MITPTRLLLASAFVLFTTATSTTGSPATPTRPENVARGGSHVIQATDQMPAAKLQPKVVAGVSAQTTTLAPFLTRPYWNPHSVNSIFDHTNPTYTTDGKIVEFDGTTALASNGVDPYFNRGYAITPGGTDYLYYDGHNGWDLGLNYENVLAAAAGTVAIAGYDVNNPGFGLTITINHPNGLTTRYAHLSQVLVSSGQAVNRGQLIAVSGNTGNSTGPHLHFGVYITSSWTAIDPWGWTGGFADPWPYQVGNLWFTGNPQNPVPWAPSNVSASTVDSNATVSWNAPGFDGGDPLTQYTVTASPGGASVTVPATSTSATVSGLTYGTSYTFTVKAANDVGWGPSSSASNAVVPSPAAFSAHLNWYDTFSAGMEADNVHLTNPNATSATALVSAPGVAPVRVTIGPGQEAITGFGPHLLAGPILIQATEALVATQRVQYYQSFQEDKAVLTGATTSYFPWYDNASSGMTSDMIHVSNPTGTAATGTVTLGSQSLSFSTPAGQESFLSFPSGTMGGPVVVNASQPVVASQRVVYEQSFQETFAQPATAAADTLYFNWYDNYSKGMNADNIHVLNPGTSSVTGAMKIGSTSVPFTIAAGREAILDFGPNTIGGPVVVTASGPVLASQRVVYYSSLNETVGEPAAAATTSSYLNWYDDYTTGMETDNVHVINPGTTTASVTVTVGPDTRTVSLAPGQEGIIGFPGAEGGPLSISSSQPVLASQRVVFYQSFSEVWSSSP